MSNNLPWDWILSGVAVNVFTTDIQTEAFCCAALQPGVQDSLWDHWAVQTCQHYSGGAWGQGGGTLLYWWEGRNARIHICGNLCYYHLPTDPVYPHYNILDIHIFIFFSFNVRNHFPDVCLPQFYKKLSLQIPNITEIQPNYGPRIGGTLITVTGPHLDAGKTRKVTLNDVPCPIKRSGNTSLLLNF